MRFRDAALLRGTRKLDDGYLVADAFAVRTGIQLYTGREVDPNNEHGLRDRETVRVYRSEDQVPNVDSLRSFSHAPVTIGHPKTPVNDANWRALAVGEVSTEATWHDNKIRIPLILKDSRAISLVERGVRELSAGYRCELQFGDGISPEGEAYDAEQINIRINHIAIVPKGRAGAECRIGDEMFSDADDWGISPLTTVDEKEIPMSTKVVVMGDQAVNVAVEDASKVEAFIAKLASDHQTSVAAAQSAHDAAIGAKDAEIADLRAKLADAESKILSDAQIDDRAKARSELRDKAKALAPNLQLDGLSDGEVRKAVVEARIGDVAGKSDDYINGVFDHLAKDAKPAPAPRMDPALGGKHRPLRANDADVNDGMNGYSGYVSNIQDAWKQPVKEQ